jgi:hypothetical protein
MVHYDSVGADFDPPVFAHTLHFAIAFAIQSLQIPTEIERNAQAEAAFDFGKEIAHDLPIGQTLLEPKANPAQKEDRSETNVERRTHCF